MEPNFLVSQTKEKHENWHPTKNDSSIVYYIVVVAKLNSRTFNLINRNVSDFKQWQQIKLTRIASVPTHRQEICQPIPTGDTLALKLGIYSKFNGDVKLEVVIQDRKKIIW